MGYLLPALTRERFETQRDVVLNERRQNYENRPYGLALMALMAAAVSAGPSVPLDDDRRRRRHPRHAARGRAGVLPHVLPPANASLVLAGDIDTGRAFDLAGHYFREIAPAPGRHPSRGGVARRASTGCCSRTASRCRGSTWRGTRPRCSPPGTRRWTCSPTLLASGKVSRLYRTLVYDRRMALDVSAFQNSRELTGFFLLVATAAAGAVARRPGGGHRPRGARAGDDGPADAEMERAVAQAEAHFLYRLQTVGRLRRQVGPAERLQRAARRSGILRRRPRAVPLGHAGERARGGRAPPRVRPARAAERRAARPAGARAAGFRTGGGVVMAVDRTRLPDVGPDPIFVAPGHRPAHAPGGLQVRTVEHRACRSSRSSCSWKAGRRRIRRAGGSRGAHGRHDRRGHGLAERHRRLGCARPHRRRLRRRGGRRRDALRAHHAHALHAARGRPAGRSDHVRPSLREDDFLRVRSCAWIACGS
jgi:hypothetical protein